MAEGGPRESVQMEKPVSRATLERVADAGYPDVVDRGTRLIVGIPLSVREGADLVIRALGVETKRLIAEADALDKLAGQSDDWEWRALFTPKVEELRAHAKANGEKAASRDEHPNS